MKSHSLTLAALMLCGCVLVCAPSAHAFFPEGTFINQDAEGTGELRIIKWPLSAFQQNADNDVSGEEGLVITIETGDGGWNSQQIAEIKAAFETWEEVPTAYAAFVFQEIRDQEPEYSSDFGSVDAFNSVVNLEDGTVDGSGIGLDGSSVVWTIQSTWVAETGIYDINGQQVQLTGPAIIDADIAVAGDFTQINNEIDVGTVEGLIDANIPLRALMTFCAGNLLGLGFSPLENLELVELQGDDITISAYIEDRVWATRTAEGELVEYGVTPTMWPFNSYYDLGNNVLASSWPDLAPDDIAGITFLYPRTNLVNFFDVEQEARTFSRYYTSPVIGGFVRAWCDADNNPNTARVPMFGTLTGLYEGSSALKGHFTLHNMFKQLETSLGAEFTPSYTFTLSDVFEPAGITGDKSTFNSTGGVTSFTGDFTRQTYLEGAQNILTDQRQNDGTPFRFDQARGQFVSVNTGNTLAQGLSGTRPMFGQADSENICVLNEVALLVGARQSPEVLRGFRDNVLLHSSVGALIADAYYRMSPSAAKYLHDHPAALALAKGAMLTFEWVVTNWQTLVVLVAAALCTAWAWRARRRARAAAMLLVFAAFLTVSGAAQAQLGIPTTEKVIESSEFIFHGEVVAAEGRWAEGNRIVTDVAIEVKDITKGHLNKSSLVHFTTLGGSVGGVTTDIKGFPTWSEGEEVVALMKSNEKMGFMPTGGDLGKYLVKTDERYGEKYIVPSGVRAGITMEPTKEKILKAREEKAAALKAEESGDGSAADAGMLAVRPDRITLDEFKEYMDTVVRTGEAQAE